MKKIIILLFTVFIFTLCGSLNKTPDWYGVGNDGSMVMVIDRDMNLSQIDSLIISDTLPSNMNQWKKWVFFNENNNESICEYVYGKNNNKVVYRLRELNDSTISVKKRIIK